MVCASEKVQKVQKWPIFPNFRAPAGWIVFKSSYNAVTFDLKILLLVNWKVLELYIPPLNNVFIAYQKEKWIRKKIYY